MQAIRPILPIRHRIGALISRLEPWYHWGVIDTYRLDSLTGDFDDEVTGEVRFFTIQWFGIHIGITIGRTPQEGS